MLFLKLFKLKLPFKEFYMGIGIENSKLTGHQVYKNEVTLSFCILVGNVLVL